MQSGRFCLQRKNVTKKSGDQGRSFLFTLVYKTKEIVPQCVFRLVLHSAYPRKKWLVNHGGRFCLHLFTSNALISKRHAGVCKLIKNSLNWLCFRMFFLKRLVMKVRQPGIGGIQVFNAEEVIDEGRFCLHLFTRRRFSFGVACFPSSRSEAGESLCLLRQL